MTIKKKNNISIQKKIFDYIPKKENQPPHLWELLGWKPKIGDKCRLIRLLSFNIKNLKMEYTAGEICIINEVFENDYIICTVNSYPWIFSKNGHVYKVNYFDVDPVF